MRYDLNLFQFVLSRMEIMCLVQESMGISGLVVRLTTRESAETTTKGIGTGNSVLVKHSGARSLWDTST